MFGTVATGWPVFEDGEAIESWKDRGNNNMVKLLGMDAD